jgi:tripartite-type tricarboxylate transporter receptor subunit TctC
MRSKLGWLILALLAGQAIIPACAQSPAWPTKPLTWIVPWPAGGPTDLVARTVAQKFSEQAGQQVVIENRPGATGDIGLEVVARAAPDGYTLLVVLPSIITNPYFFKSSPDPFARIKPIIQLTTGSFVLLTNPKAPAKTVPELAAWVKSKPGSVTCATPGSLASVGCYLLQSRIGSPMLMVPYKGAAPAMNALIGGEIDLFFEFSYTAIPHIEDGHARALGSAAAARGSGTLAAVPTIAETYPGFEITGWHGIAGPLGLPDELVERINRGIAAVLADSDVRRRLADGGLLPVGDASAAFAQRLKHDYAMYGEALKGAGVVPE